MFIKGLRWKYKNCCWNDEWQTHSIMENISKRKWNENILKFFVFKNYKDLKVADKNVLYAIISFISWACELEIVKIYDLIIAYNNS